MLQCHTHRPTCMTNKFSYSLLYTCHKQYDQQLKLTNFVLGSKIHAFIPVKHADQHEMDLRCGKICIIQNFFVQDYKPEDKFRPVHMDHQLIFSNHTRIKVLEDHTEFFPDDSFDFYDHSEHKDLANKTSYLLGKSFTHFYVFNFSLFSSCECNKIL